MKARVSITLKQGVLDPQGQAIEGALKSLSIEGVKSIRQGKIFDIELSAESATSATALLEDACQRLLANTVVENYQITLID